MNKIFLKNIDCACDGDAMIGFVENPDCLLHGDNRKLTRIAIKEYNEIVDKDFLGKLDKLRKDILKVLT